ncbi:MULTISPECIES: BtrH N-terminal domain-containing protein [Streptomyces]|uniref:BtrH N-terminal domain-containing protein n=1 Tax=Streptomyces lienomycini TaxID=284035 RepID=A0ABV9WRY6_9ACTN|nr:MULTISPECIES: BtrH N-terminal domain-containing protein [Streptomyces]
MATASASGNTRDPAPGTDGTVRLYGGEHCETSAFRKALHAHGLGLSEEMLLGLGGGIGFMYVPKAPGTPPFLATRNDPFPVFTRRMASGVGLELSVVTTTDPEEARGRLDRELADQGLAVVYADMHYLPYFRAHHHFGGHCLVVTGTDPDTGRLRVSDRPAGPRTLDPGELAAARGSRHQPFPPRHAMLRAPWSAARPPSEGTLRAALGAACRAGLEPPNASLGIQGLRMLAERLVATVRDEAAPEAVVDTLVQAFVDLRLAGTGGDGFRSMFHTFVAETAALLDDGAVADAVPLAAADAAAWRHLVATLLPAGTALGRLGEAHRSREEHLLAAAPDRQAEASAVDAELPGLRDEAVTEVKGLRQDLATALHDAVADVIARESALLGHLRPAAHEH